MSIKAKILESDREAYICLYLILAFFFLLNNSNQHSYIGSEDGIVK